MIYLDNYGRIKNDELYHHGILGQRWGKQNGPPYPIKPADHSASEKKAGYKKSIKNDEKVHGWREKQISKTNKFYDKATGKYDKKIGKLTNKLDEAKEKGKEKRSSKLDNKIKNAEMMKGRLEVAKAIEQSAINKMNLSDIRKERITMGRKIVEDALITGGTMSLAAMGMSPIFLISVSDLRAVQANYRIKNERKGNFNHK